MDQPLLIRDSEYRWVLPRAGTMRVPGVVFASEALLPAATGDRALWQVADVATLPGIVRASYAMPDIHWGYGFPIGGVAATDVDRGGVVSPGGVGFDISCGVRLLVTGLAVPELRPRLGRLMRELRRRVPAGAGPGGVWEADAGQTEGLLRSGARAAVAAGYGLPEDLEACEDGGGLPVRGPAPVSPRALTRGRHEIGSLGSGNHFLEVQSVERILDPATAESFGLHAGQVTVMIHTGSRGLGHQVCTDHVHQMLEAAPAYGIDLPDPQLAAAPAVSPHGELYLAAMSAAANFGRANRQVITWAVRQAFRSATGSQEIRLVYDVSHNLARLEVHDVEGARLNLCVHRKGATRALPPGHPDLPPRYRSAGQPVIVPGSMGTASYVLVGEAGNEAFSSTCHGAGRALSRHRALRLMAGEALRSRLAEQGVVVEARAPRSLAEEAPEAYKDVDEVVRVCAGAGLSRPVARLRPLGVLKG